MLMDVNPEQDSKHLSPKKVTDEGMVMNVNPEQLEKQ
jgi:hypothetical protein